MVGLMQPIALEDFVHADHDRQDRLQLVKQRFRDDERGYTP